MFGQGTSMQELPFAEIGVAPVQIKPEGKLRGFFFFCLDMWNLSCPLDIQMEMSSSQLNPGVWVQGGDGGGDKHWKIVSMEENAEWDHQGIGYWWSRRGASHGHPDLERCRWWGGMDREGWWVAQKAGEGSEWSITCIKCCQWVREGPRSDHALGFSGKEVPRTT